jgi:hypothetical protein
MQDFNFEPKAEDELVDLLEEGDGNYEVASAEAKTSKNGNPMIVLALKVWDKNGDQKFVYDYLILNGSKYSMRKIRHFCYSNGMEDFYNAGKFSASDCVDRTGKCVIGIQIDKTGQYAPKNVINDYKEHGSQVEHSNAEKGSADFDDDIPF